MTALAPREVAGGAATQDAAPAHAGGMFRSLRVRNYRLWAVGQLISLTGTWMQRVAQDWLVLQLTDSGLALGVVTVLQFAPQLVLGPGAGVLADRCDKRRLLFVTQTGIALVALALGVLDVAGSVAYWNVLVLSALLGVVAAVDIPVRQSFTVEMVGRADVVNAVAINSTIFNLGRIVGPALAGILISALGTGWAFIANGLSSAAVLAGLAMMRTDELFPAPQLARARGQLREGVAYVRARTDLLVPMALIFVVGAFGQTFPITSALLAKQVFHRGAGGYGLLSSALAVGACAGAVLATRRIRRPSSAFLLLAVAGLGLTEMLSGVMPGFWSTAAALVLAGVSMLTTTTSANSTVQLGVAPTMRGRVMALYIMCFVGGTPIGSPVVGWICGAAGPRWGVVTGGAVCLLSAVALAGLLARRRGVAALSIPALVLQRLRTRPA